MRLGGAGGVKNIGLKEARANKNEGKGGRREAGSYEQIYNRIT